MKPDAPTHERRDADVLDLTMVAGFLLLSIAICFLGIWGLLHLFANQRKAHEALRPKVSEQRNEFPPPRLQVDASADLIKSRAAAEAKLHSYGWIDREARVARIPIERAMQLTVERGLPEVGGGQTRLQLLQARAQTPPP